MTLTDFLLARIAEDEAAAREAHYEGRRWYYEGDEYVGSLPDDERVFSADTKADALHLARHDPARILAECQAKRRIIGEASVFIGDPEGLDAESVLRHLAAVYADHPDWRV